MYLKNDISGLICEFSNSQEGWSTPTQEEIDAYLLTNAKLAKLEVLELAKFTFCKTGFPYVEVNFSLLDESINNILLQNNLLSYNSSDVSVTAATNLYTLPTGHGLIFVVNQLIEVAGFTEAANNGVKIVASFSGDLLTVQESLTDEAAGDAISISNVDRYKYYDTVNIQQSFADSTGWNAFFNAIMPEKNRIMNYYYSKKKEIADAANMTALDAITIDFSA
jgi:hypothetical protein